MKNLSPTQIEEALSQIPNEGNDHFIYDVLLAYGVSKATMARLKSGNLGVPRGEGEILWKNKLYFIKAPSRQLKSLLVEAKQDKGIMRYNPRFLVASDGVTWACYDTKTGDTREFPRCKIDAHYDFFLPLAGYEKGQIAVDSLADVKAARRMGKLYDAIKHDNPSISEHDMNVFMARLLFCFFAEDSGLFATAGAFTSSINNLTSPDGSDLNVWFDRIFAIMNEPDDSPKREAAPEAVRQFPYVNGGLFRDLHASPHFSLKSRQAVIEAGSLDWSGINTDIFGNMFQACISPEQRAHLGEHYTSVPNIMKVLNPLFLNELREEYEKAVGDERKLEKLLIRLCQIKCFDPACGSGNFLLIAFKELRRLEMDVVEALDDVRKQLGAIRGILLHQPRVSISQFYGIEIDDFAHEIAVLSLWLVDHQMNQEFEKRFAASVPTLPLKPNDHIVLGNALRLDWDKVCPHSEHFSRPLYYLDPLFANAEPVTEECGETFIFGNPPYIGKKGQSTEQKEDMHHVFFNLPSYRILDYISAWFYLGAQYIRKTPSRCAFVSTNSITQGEQVPCLWEPILKSGIVIEFAYSSFKWTNNARNQAGVTCVILGIRDGAYARKCRIFEGEHVRNVDEISPYVRSGKTWFISSLDNPISKLPPIAFGNMPADDGALLLSEEEKEECIRSFPPIRYHIKRYVGASEFIKGTVRYCFWLSNFDISAIQNMPYFRERFEKCRKFRLASTRKKTRESALTPHLFCEIRHMKGLSIIFPRVSSENREYIPIGFLNDDTVISDAAFAIYGAEPWLFAVLTSKMHMVWVGVACGRLKTDFRYSASLCYNTFPIRPLSDEEKQRLELAAFGVLDAREAHSDKTLAELYDPKNMPPDLRKAHDKVDDLVDRIYNPKGFNNDEERLICLFSLYEQMTDSQQ